MPLIEVRNISKRYEMGTNVVHALQDVSFEIEKGAFVAIMGASGSGKTTLLDILGCLSSPTSGAYTLAGQEVSGMNEQQLAFIRNQEIGFVFQNFNLLSRTTAVANVELPMLYGRVPKKERSRRAREALEAVGLGDRFDHRPSELSGGQRQRVSIARALVNNPSIVFADEPTGNLDTKSGEGILKLFEQMHRNGHTLVLVTHERDIAERAERILNFRDGQLIKEETCRPHQSEEPRK